MQFTGRTRSTRSRRYVRLQWGHAEVGVEDMESPVENAQQIKLQWGHAEVGVEDSTNRDAAR